MGMPGLGQYPAAEAQRASQRTAVMPFLWGWMCKGESKVIRNRQASYLHHRRWLFAHPTGRLLGRCDWQSPGECIHGSSGKRSHHSRCNKATWASSTHFQIPVVLGSGSLWGGGQVKVTKKQGQSSGYPSSSQRPCH